MNNLVLEINGKTYAGWKSIRVDKSMEQIAGVFSIAAQDLFPDQVSKWGFRLGDSCVIKIDNQTIITGYVDNINVNYDKETTSFKLSGRDITGDLVDCSFSGASEFKKQSLVSLVSQLCSPYGIPVIGDSSVADVVSEIIESFVADQGETVFELITKLTMLKAVLPISFGDGKLTLTRRGTELSNDKLERGINIRSGGFSISNKNRYSNYWVKGQTTGFDYLQQTDYIQPGGQAVDKLVTRYRPIIVFAEDEITNAIAKARAGWEAKIRAARSRMLLYKVQGWTQSNGKVWDINSLVQVKDDSFSIDGTKLIVGLSFIQNEREGTITNLILTDKEAYELFESPVEKVKSDFDPPKGGAGTQAFNLFPQSLLTP